MCFCIIFKYSSKINDSKKRFKEIRKRLKMSLPRLQALISDSVAEKTMKKFVLVIIFKLLNRH